ncbi:hypothetical protein [Raoultibacter phocaeensis]|uniref:hypothetical protein n=1 Tax=Raoultibacter phocaeensis TaxID=2479841 RepID=UPI001119C5C9|nr:hypothetical protein [Raoultibacter phocaeensis]
MDLIQSSIWSACSDYLSVRTIEEIRTSEIISKAAVGRSTFYRKFRDKYEVVNFGFKAIYDTCFFSRSTRFAFTELSFLRLLIELSKRRTVVLNAVASNTQSNLRRFTVTYFRGVVVHDLSRAGICKKVLESHETVLEIYLVGIVDYLFDWIALPTSAIDNTAAAVVSLMPIDFFVRENEILSKAV